MEVDYTDVAVSLTGVWQCSTDGAVCVSVSMRESSNDCSRRSLVSAAAVAVVVSTEVLRLDDVIPVRSTDIIHARTHTHSYRSLSGCKEVENRTSQLVEPRNFPQPRNTTLMHEFYLTTTQMLEYIPTQCLPTRLPHGLVKWRWSEDLANILDLHHWPPQHLFART